MKTEREPIIVIDEENKLSKETKQNYWEAVMTLTCDFLMINPLAFFFYLWINATRKHYRSIQTLRRIIILILLNTLIGVNFLML